MRGALHTAASACIGACIAHSGERQAIKVLAHLCLLLLVPGGPCAGLPRHISLLLPHSAHANVSGAPLKTLVLQLRDRTCWCCQAVALTAAAGNEVVLTTSALVMCRAGRHYSSSSTDLKAYLSGISKSFGRLGVTLPVAIASRLLHARLLAPWTASLVSFRAQSAGTCTR